MKKYKLVLLVYEMIIYIGNPKYYQKIRNIKHFWYGGSYLWRKFCVTG